MNFVLFKVLESRKKMTYQAFEAFRNFETMDKKKIDLAADYVCQNLNNFSPNYRYYYDMYSYIVKCRIVLQTHSKTKFGESICNGKLVNFIEDDKHKNCSCSSVYYNSVF